ncbi:hypothetical protein HMPREF0083_04011 [Aneurinibacillus aneurinilyticus ATCC 12856]|uniref:Uncharacterized protein n=1 Tax=Aneurinibacillus aneurinilyticus ATCC 12856 TaxID=649747 RepID=U1YAS4_ANEAE|nr:hypothetical protein HMPREF0083_04011 [Aneurinibacillus aneurinilyticus ATCC 12856]
MGGRKEGRKGGRKNTRWPFFCRSAGRSHPLFFRISSFQPRYFVKISSVIYIAE